MNISPYIPKKWNGIMLIGEAPGEDEVTKNEPFVGRSGILLREMLLSAGINRDECYITNTFLQRPPDNRVMHFFVASRQADEWVYENTKPYNGSYYIRTEFLPELQRLKEEITLANPKIIVAIGSTAMWRLTGKQGITAERGNIYDFEGIPVLVTFHPAYVLRNRSVMPLVIDDLKKVKDFI